VILVGGGIILLFERVRTEGVARLWSDFLVALGVAAIGFGTADARDEVWWMIGAGSSLLFGTLANVAARLIAPLMILAGGLMTLRTTWLLVGIDSARGEHHGN
jgi:hypothetical protein